MLTKTFQNLNKSVFGQSKLWMRPLSMSYVNKESDKDKFSSNYQPKSDYVNASYSHFEDPKQSQENLGDFGQNHNNQDLRDRHGRPVATKERPTPYDKSMDYPDLKDSDKNMADADFKADKIPSEGFWHSAKDYLQGAKDSLMGKKK